MNRKDEKLISKLNANMKTNSKVADGQWTDGTKPEKAYYDYGDNRNDPEVARDVFKTLIGARDWVTDSTDTSIRPGNDETIESKFRKIADDAIADSFLGIVEKLAVDYDEADDDDNYSGRYTYIIHTERPLKKLVEDAVMVALKECQII